MKQFEILSGAISAFRNRLILLMTMFIVGVIVTIVYTLQQSQTYQAEAVIQIESAQVSDGGLGGGLGTSAAHRLQLIEQRLMARDNLAEMIERHSLFTADPNMSVSTKVDVLRQAITIIQIQGEEAVGFGAVAVPAGLRILVRLQEADKAADLANDLVDTVITQNENRRSSEARDTLSFFATEEDRLLEKIDELETNLARYKQDNSDLLPTSISGLNAQETSFRSAILDIDQEILGLKSDQSRQREDFVQRQVAILEEQKMLLSERLAGVMAKLQRAPDVERELAQLNRELALYQGQYDVVTQNRAEAELSLTLENRQQSERFEILEHAITPDYPVSTSRRLIFLVGAAISFFGAAAVIYIYENVNTIVRNAVQMKEELDLVPVVSIPPIPSQREMFGQRMVIAFMLALLFMVIPLVTLQFL